MPQLEKTYSWRVRPTRTLIRLRMRAVWSKSSLSAWKIAFLAIQKFASRRFWSDFANAYADLTLRWAYVPEVRFLSLLSIYHRLALITDTRRPTLLAFIGIRTVYVQSRLYLYTFIRQQLLIETRLLCTGHWSGTRTAQAFTRLPVRDVQFVLDEQACSAHDNAALRILFTRPFQI